MNDNDFDKAGRTCLHLDPPGFLRWLLPTLAPDCTFQRWADTRTIAFPGEPDRTCDTVAELLQAGDPLHWWLLVLELQSELDAVIFGRLLEYLGRVWRDLQPLYPPRQRYGVLAAVINFSGRGRNARDFRLPGTPARTCLRLVEKNVAYDSAERTLRRIASGEWTRALLPLIPLMRGGKKTDIIRQWKTVAETEPDTRRRDDYASLALVFSDLTKCRPLWTRELEGWNVKRSEQVMEWQAETMAEAVLDVLQLRFGTELPADLVERIRTSTDLALLKRWHAAAVTARTLNKFRRALEE